MKILIGCEFSGVVRRAFRDMGHDAWSCDILPSEDNSEFHIQRDIRTILNDMWDMAIFFTPCTYLCNSGVRWLHTRPERWELMRQDARLFRECMDADIPKIVNENPIPHKYALTIIGRKYDQIIQPWMFGHPESKQTCLWRKGLPALDETDNVKEYMLTLPKNKQQRNHYMAPSANRGLERSRFLDGVAKAMATQWGST